MKNPYVRNFAEGFIGSFVIAAIILMAIPRAISEFINHRPSSEQHYNQ